MRMAGAALLLGLAAPEVAAALDAPDSAALAALRARASAEPMLRVVGTFGAQVIHRPILDSSGVRSADWDFVGRPAVFVGENAPPRPAQAPIAWSRISEVEVGRTHAARGALIGVLAATMLGITLIMANPPKDESGLWIIGLPGTAIAVGSVVGAAIGASHGTWRTVYPVPAETAP
jgi:hypothetical protein